MSDAADADMVGVGQMVLSSNALGARERCDPRQCSSVAIEMLTQLAGPGMALASFSLELAPAPLVAGVEVVIQMKADKRTHTLAFLSLEARFGHGVLFSARGVFSAGRTDAICPQPVRTPGGGT